MEKSLKGTLTEQNLLKAFAGESQARNRYTYFASAAKKEGYEQISAIFLETAENEKEHAKKFFKFLEGGEVMISGAFPAGTISATVDNLKAAAAGENYEHTEMYPGFAKTAREEGFEAVAMVFEFISVAEKQHEKLYRELAANVAKDRAFSRSKEMTWRCLSCGYIHIGNQAPDKCPACVKPTGYFELLAENW